MADGASGLAKKDSSDLNPASEPKVALPPQIENAIAKIPDVEERSEVRQMISASVSRTSFGFGPDPETMKIIAETEVHEETCRLDGFKAALSNRDKQAERDHDFRKLRLNHQTAMAIIVLVVAALLIAFGIYIYTGNQSPLGGYLIVGGAALIFQALGFKPPSAPKE